MVSQIQKYLEQIIKITKKRHCSKIGDYFCFEEFVLRNGQFFKSQISPKSLKRGRMKECYRNALMLMLDNPSYFYIEGYAAGIIPAMHAWCVDKKGNVIDPTWPDGKEYFGVIFKRSYALEQAIKNGRVGLIDNWQAEWPLLRLEPSIWKETLNKT